MKAPKGRNIYNQFYIIQYQAPAERNIYSNLLEKESKAPAERHLSFYVGQSISHPAGALNNALLKMAINMSSLWDFLVSI